MAQLRAAVQHNLALGHWPAVLASRSRYAHALRRRAREPDVVAARCEQATATHEAATLGIPLPDQCWDVARARATFIRPGRRWLVEWAGRSALVEHSVGLLYLSVLLANSGNEVPAADLAAGVSRLTDAIGSASRSTQPVLDLQAIHAYRQRLPRARRGVRR